MELLPSRNYTLSNQMKLEEKLQEMLNQFIHTLKKRQKNQKSLLPWKKETSKCLNVKIVNMISKGKGILTSTGMPSVTIIMTISVRLKILKPRLNVKFVKLSSKQKKIYMNIRKQFGAIDVRL